ncbi:MAG: glycosyltransferase family 4 protein [Candidatus Cloacimonetes bacterium]|nr:glycosyltransferase family 4 protein [Candidatus Cloacimonadota bacterium]MDY0230479.1 glycosyltransferase family 4 protein [Candidatus Cloacimonadaceae bacterium]
MKVLWFSNTPANSDEYFNKELAGTGGWMKSLDKAIQKKIELHIAFYHKQKCSNFIHDNSHYYPIPKYNNFLGIVKEKIFNKVVDTEHLPIYLNIIQQVRPDIIHIHGTENPFGCIIGQTEIPIVVSIQGNITVYLHKFCSGIEKRYLKLKNLDISNYKTVLFPPTFKNSQNKFIKMQKREQKNLKSCRNVIGRTNWDRRISRILAPESRYFHNDEILRDKFYCAEWVPNKKKKIILHTTNSNNFYKGFETVCSCLYLLNNMGVGVEWRVAGISNSDLIVKIVKRLLKDRFPQKNLKLLGRLTADMLIDKLLEADIYVMPSHIENSPNNLCEAMMLGMPCIATFAGGTGSLLKDDEEGVLVQDGDPWAMAGAVLEMRNDYEKAILMAQKARNRALKRHNKHRIVDELLQIYTNIL